VRAAIELLFLKGEERLKGTGKGCGGWLPWRYWLRAETRHVTRNVTGSLPLREACHLLMETRPALGSK
jgi:hypothetical protein